MSDCIFCKIVNGEIPCAKLLETDTVIAFLDLNPIRKGHALVVPKLHAETMIEFPAESAVSVAEAIKKVGKALMDATGAAGFNVIQNNYPASGQQVPHIHWHIIPRENGDGLTFWPQGSYSGMEEMSAMAECIRKVLD